MANILDTTVGAWIGELITIDPFAMYTSLFRDCVHLEWGPRVSNGDFNQDIGYRSDDLAHNGEGR